MRPKRLIVRGAAVIKMRIKTKKYGKYVQNVKMKMKVRKFAKSVKEKKLLSSKKK